MTATTSLADYVPELQGENNDWVEPPLRDYQEQAVVAALARGKAQIRIPPGSGKTHLGIAFAIRTGSPTVFVVDTIVLLDQWKKNLADCGIDAGAWYGDDKDPKPMLLSTYQSLWQDPEIVHRYPTIIYDEGDRVTGDKFRAMLDELPHKRYALCLTATPPLDRERRELLDSAMPCVFEMEEGEMEKRGWTVPVHLARVPVVMDAEEQREYDRILRECARWDGLIRSAFPRFEPGTLPMLSRFANEERAAAMEQALANSTAPCCIQKEGGPPHRHATVLWQVWGEDLLHLCEGCAISMGKTGRPVRGGVAAIRAISAQLLRSWGDRQTAASIVRAKGEALYRVVAKHPFQRVLVFTDRLDAFDRPFWLLERHHVPTRVISGETPKTERKAILEGWGSEYYVLGAAKVVERGFNVPDCGVVVVMGRVNAVQAKQKVGRGTRPAAGKTHCQAYAIYTEGTAEKSIPATIARVFKTMAGETWSPISAAPRVEGEPKATHLLPPEERRPPNRPKPSSAPPPPSPASFQPASSL